MGKNQIRKQIVGVAESHTHSAQKLGHTHSAQKLQKTRKNRNRITSIAVSSWCHREMSFISKWLYIFALKNRNKRNLPLLLHLISAPFCSVSQSRVPTLMQRYIIIVIYKWELQSYFFIISSIRHFTASSKPFLIPCDNP